MIKDILLNFYGVKLIDNDCEGILGVELKNNEINYTIQIYCYLPPTDSPYSNTANFFGHLIGKIYINSHVDMFVLAGDFNARIGSKDDFITYIDTTPKRASIDKTTNCDVFIDFLKEKKCAHLMAKSPQNLITLHV